MKPNLNLTPNGQSVIEDVLNQLTPTTVMKINNLFASPVRTEQIDYSNFMAEENSGKLVRNFLRLGKMVQSTFCRFVEPRGS